MNDPIRKDLKELCYHIIENKEPEALPEQLTRVQMLYERLLLLNYLEEQKATERQASVAPPPEATPAPKTKPARVKPREQSAPQKPNKAFTPPAQETPLAPKPASEPVETAKPSAPAPPQPQSENKTERSAEDTPPAYEKPKSSAPEPTKVQSSLNDRLAQGNIEIGLNDRIAFVNHLFEGKQQDFIRVLSQLNTLTSVQEAEVFLEQMVKPDYNWEDKEEYLERLIELVRLKLGDQV